VGESGRLERVAGALPLEVAARKAAHLLVDEWKERVQRTRISLAPAKECLRDLGRGRDPLISLGGVHEAGV
jgi:hypothetical protein